jgi:hypothetical protein
VRSGDWAPAVGHTLHQTMIVHIANTAAVTVEMDANIATSTGHTKPDLKRVQDALNCRRRPTLDLDTPAHRVVPSGQPGATTVPRLSVTRR